MQSANIEELTELPTHWPNIQLKSPYRDQYNVARWRSIKHTG